jgi:hypothetical protein
MLGQAQVEILVGPVARRWRSAGCVASPSAQDSMAFMSRRRARACRFRRLPSPNLLDMSQATPLRVLDDPDSLAGDCFLHDASKLDEQFGPFVGRCLSRGNLVGGSPNRHAIVCSGLDRGPIVCGCRNRGAIVGTRVGRDPVVRSLRLLGRGGGVIRLGYRALVGELGDCGRPVSRSVSATTGSSAPHRRRRRRPRDGRCSRSTNRSLGFDVRLVRTELGQCSTYREPLAVAPPSMGPDGRAADGWQIVSRC